MPSGTGIWLSGAALLVSLLAALGPASMRTARAAQCGDVPDNVPDLFTVVPTPGPTGSIIGNAPLTVTVTIRGGVIVFPSGFVASQIGWGDGAAQQLASEPCPDGESAVWPQQTLSHTYGSTGLYFVTWHIALAQIVLDVPLASVVTTAAATPVAPTPTATPAAPTPTAAPAGTATAVPPATPGASPTGGGATTPAQQTPSTSGTALASATGTSAAATTPAAATATPGRSPVAVGVTTPSAGSPSSTPVEEIGSRPEVVRALRDAGEVSTDPGVAATNVVLAGATVWVLFTTVLLSQVLQDNRDEVERRTRWLTAPARWIRRAATFRPGSAEPSRKRRIESLAAVAGVLVVTGGIYSLLEPGFGWNQATAVLFLSVTIGVGLFTYVFSGLEAFATTRTTGAGAAVRAYPATIAIAIVSVAISRAIDFQPGVMYGFVASCVVLTPITSGAREKARIALVPVIAGLVVTIAAWLAIAPVRSLAGDGGGWPVAVVESVLVILFVGGIEGLFFSMIPIAATDGGKIFRWNHVVWGLLTIVGAFLLWHVLFGQERGSFSSVRETGSMTVVAVFVAYTALTVGLWAYFRFRAKEAEEAVAGGPGTGG